MAVGSEHHGVRSPPAPRGRMEWMTDRIGGHIDAAETAAAGQAEHMVVLIDGPAHRTQTVVAVCHRIGHAGTPGARWHALSE